MFVSIYTDYSVFLRLKWSNVTSLRNEVVCVKQKMWGCDFVTRSLLKTICLTIKHFSMNSTNCNLYHSQSTERRYECGHSNTTKNKGYRCGGWNWVRRRGTIRKLRYVYVHYYLFCIISSILEQHNLIFVYSLFCTDFLL